VKSKTLKISANGVVPSTDYSVDLIRKAMKENKQIIAMRAYKHWIELIPELKNHPELYRLNSPQNVALSPNNLSGYDDIVSALEGRS